MRVPGRGASGFSGPCFNPSGILSFSSCKSTGYKVYSLLAGVKPTRRLKSILSTGPSGIQGFWTGPFGGAFLVLVLDLIRSPLFASWSRKKSSLERLLSGPRRISRQVSGILGAERLPQGTLGASKMGSKIGSGLKKVKYQKM